MSLARGIIVADVNASASNVVASAGAYLRETRLAVANAANLGGLDPNPLGTPESDVDVDLLLRTPGNVDGGARWGWRAHDAADATPYKGRTPAGRISDVRLLANGNVTTTRLSKPKLLSLASGELLLVYLKGTDGVRGTTVAWRTQSTTGTWRPENGGGSGVGAYIANHVVGVDVVQMPDTGEIVMMVMTTDAAGILPTMQRFVSASDTEASTALPFTRSVCRFAGVVVPFAPTGFAVEVMPTCANRLACLFHTQGAGVGGGLLSTVSDDRGITWSTPTFAGGYIGSSAELLAINPNPMNVAGGVAIARARTGSLIALAPAIANAFGAAVAWTRNNAPRMRALVSDDGLSWTDMVTATVEKTSGLNPLGTIGISDGLLDVGTAEGAASIGDDGLMRLFGCVHGDPTANNTTTSIFDELGLLTMVKPDITSRDVGKTLTADEAGVINTALSRTTKSPLVTVSDAFEATNYTSIVSGVLIPAEKQLTFNRMSSLNGAATGQGTNALTGSPTYRGAVQLDVVNHRGALVGVVAGRDDGVAASFLTAFRSNCASELCEVLPEVSAPTSLLRGRTFTRGYWPTGRPNGQGWTSVGTPGGAVDLTNGGWKITTAGTTGAYSISSLGGIQGNPTIVAGTVVPIAGGNTDGSDIAISCAISDGVNRCNVALRFRENGSLWVHDQIADADMATVITGLSVANGIEFEIHFITSLSIEVFYRTLSANPESHGAWKAVAITTPPTTEASAADLVIWGASHAVATTEQTWRYVMISRGSVAGSVTASTALNTYYSATYLEETDDPLATERLPAWDDGLRHGTRAPRCCAYPDQYVTAGQRLRWLGAAGVANPGSVQDNWRLTSSSPNDTSRTRKLPVNAPWLSANCDAAGDVVLDAAVGMTSGATTIAAGSNGASLPQATINVASTVGFPAAGMLCVTTGSGVQIVTYTGTSPTTFTGCTGGTGTMATGGAVAQTGQRAYRHNAIALFGLNAPTVYVSYSNDPAFGSGITLHADWTGSLFCTIGTLRKTSGFVVEGGGRRIRITDGGSDDALTPGAYASDARLSWYVYSEQLNASFKVTGNDEATLDLIGDATGADAGGKTMVLYCDRLAFALTGGNLATSGYRYMRIRVGNASTPETVYEYAPVGTDTGIHYRLNFHVPGHFYDLTDPHPDWGWTVADDAVVSSLDSGAGYRDKNQESPRLRTFTYGFIAQFDALDRAAITTNPGNAAGFRRWLAALDAMAWGGRVAALLPEEDMGAITANDVYPVQFGGGFSGKHKAYDYRVLSQLTKAVLDVSGGSFREVL